MIRIYWNDIMKNDLKFYILIILGFIIALIGLIAPPFGIISNSVLLMTGQFIVLAGGIIGCVVHFDFKNLYFHIGKMDKKNQDDNNPGQND